MTTAFTVFAKTAVRQQGIPFKITRGEPNAELIAAFKEVEEIKKDPSKSKSYTDVDEMMRELLS